MRSDQNILGIKAPILVSGNLNNSPGVIIQGNNGGIKINKGVIIAKIHVHLSTEEAEKFNLKNNDLVDVYYNNKAIVKNVVVRSGELHKSHFHIDKEEAKLLGLNNNNLVELRNTNH